MNVRVDFLVQTSCGRQRLLSDAVLTFWQVGLVVWGTYRCKDDCEQCIETELVEVREIGAPFWKALEN